MRMMMRTMMTEITCHYCSRGRHGRDQKPKSPHHLRMAIMMMMVRVGRITFEMIILRPPTHPPTHFGPIENQLTEKGSNFVVKSKVLGEAVGQEN